MKIFLRGSAFGFAMLALGITSPSASAQITVRIGEATRVQARSVGITLDGTIEAEGELDTEGSTVTFTQTDGTGGIHLGSGLGVRLTDPGTFTGTTVDGPVQVQGTLTLAVADDTEIQQGVTFTVLTCSGGCSGVFDQVDALYDFHVAYGENSVTVETLEAINTGVVDSPPSVDEFMLHAAYPNPFSGSTALQLDIPAEGEVRVEAFDLLGRRVALLAEGPLAVGSEEVRWRPTGLSSGVYFVRAQFGDQVMVRRVILAR